MTVMNGWIRAHRRKTYGRMTLSTLPTTTMPQTASAMAQP